MKFIKKNLITILLIAFYVLIPVVALHADSTVPIDVTKITNPLGSSDMTIETFLLKVLEAAIKIGTPIVALAVI